jgi:hypothetical protein
VVSLNWPPVEYPCKTAALWQHGKKEDKEKAVQKEARAET